MCGQTWFMAANRIRRCPVAACLAKTWRIGELRVREGNRKWNWIVMQSEGIHRLPDLTGRQAGQAAFGRMTSPGYARNVRGT